MSTRDEEDVKGTGSTSSDSSWQVVEEPSAVPSATSRTDIEKSATATTTKEDDSITPSTSGAKLKSKKAQKWKERLAKKGKKGTAADPSTTATTTTDEEETSPNDVATAASEETLSTTSKAKKWKERLAEKKKEKEEEERAQQLAAAEAAKLVLESSSFSELAAKKRAEEAAKKNRAEAEAAEQATRRKQEEEEKIRLAQEAEEKAKAEHEEAEKQAKLEAAVREQELASVSKLTDGSQTEPADVDAPAPAEQVTLEADPEISPSQDATVSAASDEAPPTPASPDQTERDDPAELSFDKSIASKSMVVLLSDAFGKPTQRSNQEAALTKLRGRGIPFDEVDGSNPDLEALREDLFAISGNYGVYPQFFVKEGDQIKYLGDYERLEKMNDNGDLLETFAGAIMDTMVQETSNGDPKAMALPVLTTTVSRSVSFDSEPAETWDNEMETTPLPQPISSRGVSTDSAKIPDESFENEFEDPSATFLSARSMSNDSVAIPEESFENEFEEENLEPSMASRARLVSRDSNIIPEESFENEFEDSKPRHVSRDSFAMPSETFENEFDEQDAAPTSSAILDDTSSSMARRMTSQASSIVPDEDFTSEYDGDDDTNKSGDNAASTGNGVANVPLHIALGVLGVAVLAGVWFTGQRQANS